MARYRKIDPRMWGDDKFRALSKPLPNAQTLWQYLLTGTHTKSCPGLFNVGVAALAENLNWPLEQFRKRFQELLDLEMVKYDPEVHVILIPKALFYDQPDNPNVLKHWAKMYDEIPECQLKSEFYHILKQYIEGLEKELDEQSYQRFLKVFNEQYRDSLTIPLPFLNHNQKNNNSLVEDEKKEVTSELTRLLFSLIKKNDPKAKDPNWKNWEKEMKLLIETDKRDPGEVKEVIHWCQADDFWKSNILSPKKLREKFTQLKLKMEQKLGHKGLRQWVDEIKNEEKDGQKRIRYSGGDA